MHRTNEREEAEEGGGGERMERGGRGRITRGMLPLLGFQVLSEYSRLHRKPPVTAGLLLTNTLIYLRPGFLHKILPTLDQVWFNPHLILKVNKLICSFHHSFFFFFSFSSSFAPAILSIITNYYYLFFFQFW